MLLPGREIPILFAGWDLSPGQNFLLPCMGEQGLCLITRSFSDTKGVRNTFFILGN